MKDQATTETVTLTLTAEQASRLQLLIQWDAKYRDITRLLLAAKDES